MDMKISNQGRDIVHKARMLVCNGGEKMAEARECGWADGQTADPAHCNGSDAEDEMGSGTFSDEELWDWSDWDIEPAKTKKRIADVIAAGDGKRQCKSDIPPPPGVLLECMEDEGDATGDPPGKRVCVAQGKSSWEGTAE